MDALLLVVLVSVVTKVALLVVRIRRFRRAT